MSLTLYLIETPFNNFEYRVDPDQTANGNMTKNYPHALIQEFLSGGSSLDKFFFLVLSLFYSLQRGPLVLLQRKLYFAKNPEGSNIFQGVHFFPVGPNANFYRNPNNL